MKPQFIYSDQYDISMYGIEKLHPFDGKKYSRAWKLFCDSHKLDHVIAINNNDCASDEFLKLAHSADYLERLTHSTEVARVIEIELAKLLPNSALQTKLLAPAKRATYGTWLATQAALKERKVVMNFGGGFHHAYTDHGEGFCFFADAALSILHARHKQLLTATDEILMIDLDAHRGNGFESFFTEDRTVKIFDMYNFQTYPGMHPGDIDDFPFMIPLRAGMSGDEYIKALKDELPTFFESSNKPALAFYNAGTDILKGDALGGLNVLFEQVVERDHYVISQLVSRGIPTVVMTSGGYTKDSYKLVAKLAGVIMDTCN